MPPYFAYGSNMDPEQMSKRVPTATPIGVARLDGYRISFSVESRSWGGGVCNIEPAEGSRVWGVLWDADDEALSALDTYEGHPSFYRREQVEVEGPEGPVTAWTYRVAHQERMFVPPTDAYLQGVIRGIRMFGLPPEALDAVERAANPPRPTIG